MNIDLLDGLPYSNQYDNDSYAEYQQPQYQHLYQPQYEYQQQPQYQHLHQPQYEYQPQYGHQPQYEHQQQPQYQYQYLHQLPLCQQLRQPAYYGSPLNSPPSAPLSVSAASPSGVHGTALMGPAFLNKIAHRDKAPPPTPQVDDKDDNFIVDNTPTMNRHVQGRKRASILKQDGSGPVNTTVPQSNGGEPAGQLPANKPASSKRGKYINNKGILRTRHVHASLRPESGLCRAVATEKELSEIRKDFAKLRRLPSFTCAPSTKTKYRKTVAEDGTEKLERLGSIRMSNQERDDLDELRKKNGLKYPARKEHSADWIARNKAADAIFVLRMEKRAGLCDNDNGLKTSKGYDDN